MAAGTETRLLNQQSSDLLNHMESKFGNQHGPASLLKTLGADRARLGRRMTTETWWAAPAQGLSMGLMVAAPAAGLAWAWLPFALSLALYIGVELLFRRRSGLNISMPAGPRGLWLLAGLCLLIIFSFMLSLVLALFGLNGWVLAVALAAGVATTFIVVAYDRTYAAEVHGAD